MNWDRLPTTISWSPPKSRRGSHRRQLWLPSRINYFAAATPNMRSHHALSTNGRLNPNDVLYPGGKAIDHVYFR